MHLDYFTMGVGLLAGLALFLYGMEKMAEALKLVAGQRMREILARLTTNRVTGVATGALVTAIIQSSSVTTVLTVGFVTAGILNLSQAVGIIFGANIGTTLTAQIIAFKITAYALLMVGVGFLMAFVLKNPGVRQYGAMLMGLGLLFMGMDMMSEAMQPLRSYAPFIELLSHMENPLLGILVAAAFTALVQSSSATTGIIIVMASQGLIPLQAGIALILGANVGTCVTAILSSLGKPVDARRTAMVHVLFNIFGVLLWVGLIGPLEGIVIRMSPVADGLAGIDKLAAEAPRQIANAHTVFNIANTFIFLPFAPWFATLAIRLVNEPEDEAAPASEAAAAVTAQHLDPSLLVVPPLALQQARLELGTMAGELRAMLQVVGPAFRRAEDAVVDDLLAREAVVDRLDEQISDYLVHIARADLTREGAEGQTFLLHLSNELEHIGDVIEKHLVPLLQRKARMGIVLSDDGEDELADLFQRVAVAFEAAQVAVTDGDAAAAQRVLDAGDELRQLEVTYRRAHYARLTARITDAADRNQIYLDCTDYLLRIHSYSESIARTVLAGTPG